MTLTESYTILGVSSSSTETEVKRAYRNLAKKYHPDKNPGDKDSEKKFREISNAKDTILKNKEQKSYFSGGFKHKYQNPFSCVYGFDDIKVDFGLNGSFDISFNLKGFYSDFLRNIKARNTKNCPEIEKIVHTTLEDSFREYVKEIVYDRNELCNSCGWKGGEEVNCNLCHGINPYCRQCHGRGTYKQKCTTCDGKGYLTKTKRVAVSIPRSTRSNDRLLLKGAGHGLPFGHHQDLYVIIREEKHKYFRRKDRDLEVTMNVKHSEITQGSCYKIKIPSGELINIKFKSTIKDGDIIRVPGKGAYYPRSDQRGDLIVKIQILSPVESDETRGTFERLRELEKDTEYA